MINPLFIGQVLSERAEVLASEASARSMVAQTRAMQGEFEMMRLDIERLLMITESLWDILKEKHGYTDDELIARVQGIDMQDGRLDGRVARQAPTACPKCGRPAARKRVACMYCGMANPEYPFAR